MKPLSGFLFWLLLANDAVTGEVLTISHEIKLATHDERWLRLEKNVTLNRK